MSDAHRKRHARAGGNGHSPGVDPDAVADMPDVMSGRARLGLEAWAATRTELPEHLLEAARVLADEVDTVSDHSPLWGRYADVLRQLTEASNLMDPEQARALVEWQFTMSTGCDDEAHVRAFMVHCSTCCKAGVPHGAG